MAQLTIQQAFDLGLQHHQAGRLREAEQLYKLILAHQPAHVGAIHFLGVMAHQEGQNDVALDLLRKAIALAPNLPEPHINLGLALAANGQTDEAIAAYRKAVSLRPGSAEAHYNLGVTLTERGQLDEAISACQQAIALRPSYAKAYCGLGNALRDKGRLDDATAAYRQSIAADPNLPEAHNCLGNALAGQGQLDEAIAAYRQAISLRLGYAEAHSNLGSALDATGQIDQAIAAYRQAAALDPTNAKLDSNVVYALHFHPAYDAARLAEEHRRWNRQHAEPLRKFIQPHSNDPSPERRLRIGYVSPDFREHCQMLFTIPLLSAHDQKNVEIFCYADVVRPDGITDRLQGYAHIWTDIKGKSDTEVAAIIRRDRIDILVDLTMHMAGNRLLLFARKPAPVQVCWLAYPSTTGLTAIDYRISDPYLDPLGIDESAYAEKTIRLPNSFWCYDPLECRDIPIGVLPAMNGNIVTFGCLNNFCKVNDGVLALWGRVLRAVPGSRLLLLAAPGGHRQRTVDRLGKEGIDRERIEFVAPQPRREYMQVYHRIDVGLDTVPYNGHTTSLDSLWMGVPVITLVGQTPVSRAGWCQLSNLGLSELAGKTADEFVKIAVDLANDLPRLQVLRSTLRQRMERSPLMDAPHFARGIEAAYRQMWREWCAKTLPCGR